MFGVYFSRAGGMFVQDPEKQVKDVLRTHLIQFSSKSVEIYRHLATYVLKRAPTQPQRGSKGENSSFLGGSRKNSFWDFWRVSGPFPGPGPL